MTQNPSLTLLEDWTSPFVHNKCTHQLTTRTGNTRHACTAVNSRTGPGPDGGSTRFTNVNNVMYRCVSMTETVLRCITDFFLESTKLAGRVDKEAEMLDILLVMSKVCYVIVLLLTEIF